VVYRNDAFGFRRAMTQSAVWPDGVVRNAPFFFSQDLSFPQAVEYFTIKQLVSEPASEAKVCAIDKTSVASRRSGAPLPI